MQKKDAFLLNFHSNKSEIGRT